MARSEDGRADARGASVLRAGNLAKLPGIRHAFTTRIHPDDGGVLDLARRHGARDRDDDLLAAWASVVSQLDPCLRPEDVALLHQVHGPTVVEVSRGGGPLSPVADADGAITREPGVVLTVRTADCVPVLIAGVGAIAVAHAGWRGVVAGVVPATIEALVRAGERAEMLSAAIGPAISGAVYEVGDEVIEGLRGAGLSEDEYLVTWSGPRGRPHVDLIRAVAAQLRRAGLRDIEASSVCTFSDPRMHSHRRDAVASGRQAGVIVRMP